MYTDVVTQALQLKRTTRELEEARRTIETLHQRLRMGERVASEASTQSAVDIARVERQRDELRDVVRDKTNELAVVSERLEVAERELELAQETIARLRNEASSKTTDPFYVRVRPDNAYDALFAQTVKSSGDRKMLVNRYRDIETHTSNMTWQTFVDETMLTLRGKFFSMNIDGLLPKTVQVMVQTMNEKEAIQPSFVRYVQRDLEYEEARRKNMTKKQLAIFEDNLKIAHNALVHAWLVTK